MELLLDYSNQSGRGASASLKGYTFEHTILPLYSRSFNYKCAIVKEAQDTYLKWVNLQLNWCPSISTIPVLNRLPFINLQRLP